MEDKIYVLAEPLEDCQYCKVNFEIDEDYVNADLGNYQTVNNKTQFVAEYTSAVIPKFKIVNYAEDKGN